MIINSDNPFVWNEYQFSNLTNLPYNKTTLYYFHIINNLLAFTIGAFLMCLLSYCISRKTPLNFKPYSKMLWLCVATDSIILLTDLMLQIVGFFEEILMKNISKMLRRVYNMFNFSLF